MNIEPRTVRVLRLDGSSECVPGVGRIEVHGKLIKVWFMGSTSFLADRIIYGEFALVGRS